MSYDFTNNRSAVFLRYYNGDIEAKIKIVVRFDSEDEVSSESWYKLSPAMCFYFSALVSLKKIEMPMV